MTADIPVTSAGPRSEAGALWRPLGWAVALDTAALLPIGLFGALGVVVLRDLRAPSSVSGLVVGSFFLAGAIFISCFGPYVDRVGWPIAAAFGLTLAAIALTAVAVVASPWPLLVGWFGLAGVASATIQTASSVYLATAVDAARRGFAISLKFAGVPTAMTVSGLAVPLIASVAGWRWTYAVAAGAVTLGVAVALLGGRGARSILGSRPARGSDGVRRSLLATGVAMFLGSMLSGVLLGFTSPALVESGWSAPAAGTIFAGLGLLAILARAAVAVVSIRDLVPGHLLVSSMLAIGGAGAALVATGVQWAVVAGAALAFAFGWGWTGETFHLAARAHPETPGAAVSVVQSGGMFGSAAGPLVGAPLVQALGDGSVWLLVAGSCVAASTLMALIGVGARRAGRGAGSSLEERHDR